MLFSGTLKKKIFSVKHCMQNPRLATHDVTRDEGMTNGRDVDDQRIDL